MHWSDHFWATLASSSSQTWVRWWGNIFKKIFVTLTTGPMHPALGWLHAPLAILLLTFRHTKIEKYFRSIVSKIIWAQKLWWAGNSCTYQTFSLTIGWIYQNTKSSGCWQMRPTLVVAHKLELETNPGMSSCLRWRSISQAEAGVFSDDSLIRRERMSDGETEARWERWESGVWCLILHK